MNSKRSISLFLSGFLLIGSWCYAGDPQASTLQSSPATVVAIPVKAPATGQWSDGWCEGASGYDKGVEEYRRTNKPMVVYMSVGWCPYCRRFEKDVLSSPLVQDALKDKIKVHINPESGQRENALAFQYAIRGFPSFFLHPPQPARTVQLYTGVTAEKFVEFFKQVLQ